MSGWDYGVFREHVSPSSDSEDEGFVRVWRVERPDGWGPHRNWDGHNTWGKDMSPEGDFHGYRADSAWERPNVWGDAIGEGQIPDGEERYGCTSELALCAWFSSEDRRELDALGALMAVYDVAAHMVWTGGVHEDGAQQCVFNRLHAFVVERVPLPQGPHQAARARLTYDAAPLRAMTNKIDTTLIREYRRYLEQTDLEQ